MARTHRVNYHPGQQTLVMKCIVNSCICLDVLHSFCSHLSYNQLQDLSPGLFVSFPQKRNGIVFSSGVNYLHSGGNIQSE